MTLVGHFSPIHWSAYAYHYNGPQAELNGNYPLVMFSTLALFDSLGKTSRKPLITLFTIRHSLSAIESTKISTHINSAHFGYYKIIKSKAEFEEYFYFSLEKQQQLIKVWILFTKKIFLWFVIQLRQLITWLLNVNQILLVGGVCGWRIWVSFFLVL